MAVSDAMLGIMVASALTYFSLLRNKTRLWRFIGAGAFIMLGGTLVMVEDTIVMFAIAGVMWIISGMHLFEDIADLTNG